MKSRLSKINWNISSASRRAGQQNGLENVTSKKWKV